MKRIAVKVKRRKNRRHQCERLLGNEHNTVMPVILTIRSQILCMCKTVRDMRRTCIVLYCLVIDQIIYEKQSIEEKLNMVGDRRHGS